MDKKLKDELLSLGSELPAAALQMPRSAHHLVIATAPPEQEEISSEQHEVPDVMDRVSSTASHHKETPSSLQEVSDATDTAPVHK